MWTKQQTDAQSTLEGKREKIECVIDRNEITYVCLFFVKFYLSFFD